MKATYAMSLWSLLSPNRETTGLESHTSTYLLAQQVQTVRVTEIFFRVKHLQEEDKNNSSVTDVYRCCRNSSPGMFCNPQVLLSEKSESIAKGRQRIDTVNVNRRTGSKGPKVKW